MWRLEMGLKVEEKRIFLRRRESGKFLILCLRVFDLPQGGGCYVIYRERAYKRTYSPLSTLQLFYYSITLLLYSISSFLSLLCYKRFITKKGLCIEGVLGRDCQRPRRQTGSKHESKRLIY
ncbi:hypothetical protein VN97_g8707 [Penicillium thymicola]|uniref:Uncharacterized protein n=1 Tax=Penicillium thymicola TaxID=293382 RepID=A0AAI9X5Y9_PENTH|nr:hypothetical protein VN97_g8707 [Penicillium thymicola]